MVDRLGDSLKETALEYVLGQTQPGFTWGMFLVTWYLTPPPNNSQPFSTDMESNESGKTKKAGKVLTSLERRESRPQENRLLSVSEGDLDPSPRTGLKPMLVVAQSLKSRQV